VIVGDIGYRDHMVFTALGDAVNVAARLQDMTKGLGCEAVVSDEVRVTAGVAADALRSSRSRSADATKPMIVRTVTDTRCWRRWLAASTAPRRKSLWPRVARSQRESFSHLNEYSENCQRIQWCFLEPGFRRVRLMGYGQD